MTTRIAIALAIGLCVVGPGCSGEAKGPSAFPAELAAAEPTAGPELQAHPFPSPAAVNGCFGRNCPPSTGACTSPEAPPHGTVRVGGSRYGITATYACSVGYNLVGAQSRMCQPDGTWSGTAPTCAFAAAGSSCGSCGGTYDVDGRCSIDTPADLGQPCDVASGRGACARGGVVACGGVCQPSDPSIGVAAWHIFAAPNGSWDWDCDGAVSTTLVPTAVPPECATYGDLQTCNDAPTIDFVTEVYACGAQATIFTRDCDWKTLGPTCLDTPAGHRVVFQQCR